MDRTFVTKVRLPDGSWEKGPTVEADNYGQAEKAALKHFVGLGYNRSDLTARAKRLDAKSVWPGGIDGGMTR